MFTKDEVNNLVLKYNSDFKRNIPMFEAVEYDEEKAEASVKLFELSNDKFIIHISNDMNSYHLKYQESVLYHEFTHVFDFITFKDKSDNVSDIVKSYSEMHAELCKIKYLISIFNKVKILNVANIKVYDKNEIKSLSVVSGNYFNQSVHFMNKFLSNYDPYDIDDAIGNILYLCGYLSLEIKGKLIFKKVMDLYPPKYRESFLKIGLAALDNKPIVAAQEYNNLINICKNDSVSYVNEFYESKRQKP